jgi:serine/threonine protein kinase
LGRKNRKLEDFEFIGKTLGQGCNATVRKAVDKYTKEEVAIKTYNRMKISDAIKKKSIM